MTYPTPSPRPTDSVVLTYCKPEPEPEPEPEPVVYVDPEEIVRFSLDIILRGVDRAIEAKVREANLASQGPSFAERKRRPARDGRTRKDNRASIDLNKASPLYGYRRKRQDVDPAARPNGL